MSPPPGVARLLGWTLLSIDPERGEIRVRFEAKPDFLNPAGTVQGGILSAMLDDTMGPAAVALLGGNRFTQTLELKTSFYRPARPGPIVGFGRVAHRGRELVFLEATLSDEVYLKAASSMMRAVEVAAASDFPWHRRTPFDHIPERPAARRFAHALPPVTIRYRQRRTGPAAAPLFTPAARR
jgi:uncharacterized protein (TIGR00369 family)